jgi:hypothetical protein
MSLSADLLAATRAALAAHAGVCEQPAALSWAERHGRLGDDPAVMRSWAWATPALAWLRLALLDGGARTQVVSVLGIPRAAFDLPLFGAEVVCISGSATVVALDWIPLFPGSPYIERLPAIRRRFDHFPPGGDLPAWAAESFSPAALFSRPRGAVTDSDILQAFTAYFAGYLGLCDHAAPHGDPERTRAAQRRYCAAHAANDPGAAMLAKIFGAAWAASYARAFLFRLARMPA